MSLKTTLFWLAAILFLNPVWAQVKNAHDKETYRKIDSIQKSYMDQLPSKMKAMFFDDAFYLKQLKDLDAQFPSAAVKKEMAEYQNIKVYTTHQEKISYALIGKSLDTLHAILKGSPFTFPCGQHFKYASLLSNDVNAEVRNNVNGETVIFVNSKTTDFAYELARLLVEGAVQTENKKGMLLSSSQQLLKDAATTNTALQYSFVQLVDSYYTGRPHATLSVYKNSAGPVGTMIEAMYLFVVSHEFAHAAFCHNLNAYQIKTERINMRDPATKLLLKQKTVASWKNEVAADAFAQMMLDHFSEMHVGEPLCYLYRSAGYVFLHAMEILERSQYLIKNKREPFPLTYQEPILGQVIRNFSPGKNMFLSTGKLKIDPDSVSDKWLRTEHPPMFYRKNTLYSFAQENLKDYIRQHGPLDDQSGEFTRFGFNIYVYLETLFNVCKPDIIALGTSAVDKKHAHLILRNIAQLYVTAIRKKDYNSVANYLYPPLIHKMGGKIAYAAQVRAMAKNPNVKSPFIVSSSIGKLQADTVIGNTTFNILPVHYVTKKAQGFVLTNSFLVGISTDKGKHWSLIDGSLNADDLEQIIPGAGRLDIPDPSQEILPGYAKKYKKSSIK